MRFGALADDSEAERERGASGAKALVAWHDDAMTAASPHRVSYEEYLALEDESDVKHEWCDGVVYAMSRGSIEHARLTARTTSVLRGVLGADCELFASEAMLFVEAASLSTYADIIVVCGPLERKVTRDRNGKSKGEAITNPTIVVEVLSDSTERYDRDGKFQAYKKASSLEEYVLVSQDERIIEVYKRGEGDAWSCQTASSGGEVQVHGASVRVDDVYGPEHRFAFAESDRRGGRCTGSPGRSM
jgi:Uma2 family endonuclease